MKAAALAALAVASFAAPTAAGVRLTIADVRAADSLAARAPEPGAAGAARDRALIEWSRRASLGELMFVLRRPPGRLGAAEAPMVRAALDHAGADRLALRRRLAQRLAAADPGHVGPLARDLALGPPAARPYASVFRVALLLPDSGGYDEQGRALRAGLAAGLASRRDPLTPPIELMTVATGDEAPDQIVRAFDRAADSAAIVVGAMQAASTAAIVTAGAALHCPVLSPIVTDERLGAGAWTFQVGPSAAERGAALARAMLAGGRVRRVGVLVPAGAADPMARGFAAAAESAGAVIAWRGRYANPSELGAAIEALRTALVEALFWSGTTLDTDVLLRRLADAKWTPAIGGGAELDPERHHAGSRAALAGATWVSEDWRLDPGSQEALDRAAGSAIAGDGAAAIGVRGFLAGRAIAEAVATGALTPEELAASLARRASDRALGAAGFLAWRTGTATIPLCSGDCR